MKRKEARAYVSGEGANTVAFLIEAIFVATYMGA